MAFYLTNMSRRRIIASQPNDITREGSIVSFGTNIARPMQVTCTLSPVQSGSGDPYPPGGGKNKLPTILSNIKALNTSGTWNDNAYTYRGITVTVETDASGNVTGFKAQGTSGSQNMLMDIGTATYPAGEYVLNGSPVKYGCMLYDGTSSVKDEGSGATFTLTEATEKTIKIRVAAGTNLTTPVYFYPMIRLASVTDGTFATYSNIRPITGWTGCDVTGAGVNLFDKTANDTDKGFVTGYYLLQTGALNQGSDWRISEYFKVKPNTAYTLSGLTGSSPSVCFYDGNKAFVSGTKYNGSAEVTVTTGATVAYCRLSFKTDNINSVQIEQGSSASPYTAYAGTTIHITWSE